MILLMLFSCKNDSDELHSIDSLKIVIEDSSSVVKVDEELDEARIVADTQILFFMPSPEKKKDIVKFYGLYNQYEFQTVFSNFSNLANSVKSAMYSHDIKVEVTYATKFIFPIENDTLIYDLELEDQILGYILTDGKNMPLIKNGVQLTKDVSNDIRNYYNLANFSIYD